MVCFAAIRIRDEVQYVYARQSSRESLRRCLWGADSADRRHLDLSNLDRGAVGAPAAHERKARKARLGSAIDLPDLEGAQELVPFGWRQGFRSRVAITADQERGPRDLLRVS